MTVQATMTKRRKESPSTSRVDELPAHILRSIFNRLRFNDLVQAKSVCCSWNLLGDELTSKMPWLMLPSKKQVEEDDGIKVNNNGYHGFLNLKENRLYSLKTAPKEFSECCCIGSSHGWLVFLQEKAVPFLFNPFKQLRIELPSVDRQLGLEKMDIICHRNHLYALSDKNSIEVWDLHIGGNHVKKKSDFVFAFPDKSLAKEKSFRDVCTSGFYLVESCGDLLFVVRFIGDYVDWDGTLLHEQDHLTQDSNHPKVCPYRTFLFHVYKMDFKELKWVEMDTLGDRALFLGRNQLASVSTRCFLNCEKDCIYFSDDCWERIDEDYLYGGHDMGIYNLKDGSLKPVFEFSSDKIQPQPCWVIPDPAMFES
ncbi:putative Adenine nucleotide alpha hydrolases-like superfamily protein [Hibiscus syriacus]|uniref:Adenine nucleotide alpha hydrolases-like superfamily protein n=1 Tax=Hibiscus syriacus TaxID=106335 RepID=A0A6A3A508_HIBSY|nr:putative Adenine nucleotide alpha hydrolases-like superfamily protein [Hibiscus syriacus]